MYQNKKANDISVKQLFTFLGPKDLTKAGVPPGISQLVTNYVMGTIDKLTKPQIQRALQEIEGVLMKKTTRQMIMAKVEEDERKKPRPTFLIRPPKASRNASRSA